MRTTQDRLRHSVLYEVVLLAICTPLLSIILHQPPGKTGSFGLMLSLTAMTWNYIYNVGFDKALVALGRPLYPRGFWLRSLHAVLFEGGLAAATIPAMMWWLQCSFWQAFAIDFAFLLIVPFYTLLYNWLYDCIFPPPCTPAVVVNR